jgi:hypothetical protein
MAMSRPDENLVIDAHREGYREGWGAACEAVLEKLRQGHGFNFTASDCARFVRDNPPWKETP